MQRSLAGSRARQNRPGIAGSLPGRQERSPRARALECPTATLAGILGRGRLGRLGSGTAWALVLCLGLEVAVGQRGMLPVPTATGIGAGVVRCRGQRRWWGSGSFPGRCHWSGILCRPATGLAARSAHTHALCALCSHSCLYLAGLAVRQEVVLSRVRRGRHAQRVRRGWGSHCAGPRCRSDGLTLGRSGLPRPRLRCVGAGGRLRAGQRCLAATSCVHYEEVAACPIPPTSGQVKRQSQQGGALVRKEEIPAHKHLQLLPRIPTHRGSPHRHSQSILHPGTLETLHDFRPAGPSNGRGPSTRDLAISGPHGSRWGCLLRFNTRFCSGHRLNRKLAGSLQSLGRGSGRLRLQG